MLTLFAGASRRSLTRRARGNDVPSSLAIAASHYATSSASSLLFRRSNSPNREHEHLERSSSSSSSSSSSEGSSGGNEINNAPARPRLSVAVVGAGPSGFYAAKYLSSSVTKRIKASSSSSRESESTATSSAPSSFPWSGVDVDVVERLPVPYGLVRYGVAPDHPEVKNVENDFASLFRNDDDEDDDQEDRHDDDAIGTLSYFGNVDVGKDVPLSELRSLYDVVILAYGCQAADRRLGVPGEDNLEGVLSAREFVAWYNGHPEFGWVGSVVRRCLWPSSEEEERSGDGKNDVVATADAAEVSPARAVVIGQGNVALDVARILAKGGPGLVDTDTPTSVLEVLRGGAARVDVVGRRGHAQGAFTIKELRELTKLKEEGHDATFVVRRDELDSGMTESSKAELKGASGRPKARIDKLLRKASSTEEDEALDDAAKRVELRFLMSPVSMEPADDANGDRVGSVVFERTRLEGEPFRQRPVGKNERETIPADLVLVSIGYRGMPLEEGMEGMFDEEKGVVANDRGRVAGESNLFVTGWIKRGPTGIVGTNIIDAKDTVHSVMQFIESDGGRAPKLQTPGGSNATRGRAGLAERLRGRGVDAIDWRQFRKIDAAERDRGRLRSDLQPREKILSFEEMLDAAS